LKELEELEEENLDDHLLNVPSVPSHNLPSTSSQKGIENFYFNKSKVHIIQFLNEFLSDCVQKIFGR